MTGNAGTDIFPIGGMGDPLYGLNNGAGDVLDGGFGVDYLDIDGSYIGQGIITYGSLDLSPLTLSSIEVLNFRIQYGVDVTLSADEVAFGLAPNLQITGGVVNGNRVLSSSAPIIIHGSPGVPVDVSGWTWSSQVIGDLTFVGSAGADELILPMPTAVLATGANGVVNETVTLGGGSDVLILSPTGFRGVLQLPAVVVNDFQPGPGGDVLDLVGFLDAVLQNYTPGSDPFASFRMTLSPSSTGTYVEIDTAGNGQFQTIVDLRGVLPSQLTAANLGGLTPPGAAPGLMQMAPAAGGTLSGGAGDDDLYGQGGNDVLHGGAGANLLDGGGGLNTATFEGLSRTYMISVAGDAGNVSGGPEGATDTLASIQRLQFVDGYLATSPTDTAGEVYRLYEGAFDRAPDQAGLAAWTHLLNSGTSLQAVADGFVGSPEFQSQYGGLDNTAFVTLLYSNVMQRTPDTAGLQGWVDFLNAGHSRAEVLLGFTESAEDIRNLSEPVREGLWVQDPSAAEVARLYDTVFGRLPDAAGLTGWTHVLQGGATLQSVADGFIGSPEFASAYNGLDNTAFVTLLYHNVLHRDPDQTGLNAWVNTLVQGYSRAEVVVGFSESAEHITGTAPHADYGIWLG